MTRPAAMTGIMSRARAISTRPVPYTAIAGTRNRVFPTRSMIGPQATLTTDEPVSTTASTIA
ncbi:hypothetical protein [Nonomuraea sp. NPDC046570]|uniref:hypothetical protein n=1 Tax=Nonomuraea sp. NPDC046570 TaxID=3155255 RepID=UPI0033D878E6